MPQSLEPKTVSLSAKEKAASALFALTIAGYAGFADAITCLFMVKPIRSEYEFSGQVTEEQWFVVTVFIASIYGLYTLLTEGKGSYDTAGRFFLNRPRKAAPQVSPEPVSEDQLELVPSQPPAPSLEPPSPAPLKMTCRRKLSLLSVGLAARLICLIGSAADSTEVTMGLADEQAGLPKIIAISTLSFLGSLAFYGPIAVEAFEELFLGKASAAQ